jgi:hypothetical protein
VECDASAGDLFSFECEFCGGTSFSYVQTEEVEQVSQPVDLKSGLTQSSEGLFSKYKMGIGIGVLVVALFAIGLNLPSGGEKNQKTQDGYWSTICRSQTNFNGDVTRTICQQHWNQLFPARDPNKKVYIAQPPDENLSSSQTTASSDSVNNGKSSSRSDIQKSIPKSSKSTPTIICKPNLICPVGSIGPAGGVVFYDAGTKQSWGRYLEISIKDLPEVFGWCSSTDAEGINLDTSKEIGSGYSNTQKIRSKCNQDSSNAGLVAIHYASGGFSDWFIPSLDELLKLSHSVAWKEIEPIANGSPIATSTQSETDSRYEYTIQDGSLMKLFGGPVVVPMVRAF